MGEILTKMAYDFIEDKKGKKGKKEDIYSFLEGIEDSQTEKVSKDFLNKKNGDKKENTAPKSSENKDKSIELNLTANAALKNVKGEKEAKKALFKTIKNRIKDKDSDLLKNFGGEISSDQLAEISSRSASQDQARPKAGNNEPKATKLKLGGLLGEALTEEGASIDTSPDVISGLTEMEKSAKLQKEVKGDVIETGAGYKIIEIKGEKSPIYLVSMPQFSKDDKDLLRIIGKRAISEIDLDPEAIQNYSQKKKIVHRERH